MALAPRTLPAGNSAFAALPRAVGGLLNAKRLFQGLDRSTT